MPRFFGWNAAALAVCAAAFSARFVTACASGETGPSPTSGSTTVSSGTGNETVTGLPCEIATLISERCASCHSDPPKQNAPNRMLTREDFLVAWNADPSMNMGQVSAWRMRLAGSPMPPEGGVPEDQILAFEAWVAEGMPNGSCDPPTPVVDPAFEGGLTCVSGKHWPEGEEEYLAYDKEHMEPGEACNTCHTKPSAGPVPGDDDDDDDDDDGDDDDGDDDDGDDDDGPEMAIAGTVYPSGHDDRRCFGIPGAGLDDVRVIVTGADGVEHTLVPNETGNFYLEAEDGVIAKPYTAKVVSKKGERVMKIKASHVDCNVCHTPEGANVEGDVLAPGRIVIPW